DSNRAKQSAHKAVDETKEIGREVDKRLHEPRTADEDFETHKQIRLLGVRAERAMLAAQPPMLTSIADHMSLTDASRTTLLARVGDLRQDLADADAKIGELAAATPADFTRLDAAVADAMAHLEDASKSAWAALKDAERTGPAS